jgi:hypothetical protein
MGGEMIRLPSTGPPHRAAYGRVRPYWLARGLCSAWLFGEGTGRPRDLVSGTLATPTNAPAWAVTGEGPVARFTSASSQYYDLGRIPALEGAARATVLLGARRTASGSKFSIQRYTSTTDLIEIVLWSDGNCYISTRNGAMTQPSFAASGTAWERIALRFDGGASTDALKTRAWRNGAEQTLASVSTQPSAFSASATAWALGRYQFDGTTSDGDAAWALFFREALEPEEIGLLSREPHALLDVPGPVWPITVTGAADVGSISDESPAPDDPRAELDPPSARFTAADAGDPIVAVTATIDGNAATVTTDEVSATVTDAEITDELLHGRTYTVVWTIEAESGATESFPAYSFTTRDAEHAPTPIAYVAGGTVAAGASPIALTVRGTGLVREEHLELSVQEGTARGAYHSEPLYLIVGEYVLLPHALALALSVGDLEESDLALAMQVEGRPTHPLALSLAVTGRVLYDALPVSMDTGEEGFSSLPLALAAGDLEESELPLAVDVEATQLPALPAVVVMRNEDRAAEEDE